MAAAAACDDDHDAWPYVHQIPSPTPQARLRPLPEIPIRPSTESAAQAKQFAESGWVCIGPAGNAVNSHDLAIFEMLGEECPENVGRWFVHAVVCGFFDTKVGVPRDDNDEPVYVVFRGAGDGPGFYRTWEEVVPVVVGRHGALYQKCQGWVEGALRLVQALCIGGIISHLADDAWAAEDLRRWLSALQPSSLLPLHTSPGLLPFQAGSAPNHGGRVGDDYTRPWEPTRWTLFDVSKRVQAERSPQMHPLAPRPLRTHNSSPILLSPSISRYPPRTPSARRFLSRSPSPHPFTPSPPRRQTPPLSAVGGYIPDRWERLPTVPGSPPAGSPPPHCTSSSSPHVDGREGVYSLQRGGAPWLYYTE